MRLSWSFVVVVCACGTEELPLDVSADQPLPIELRAGDVIHQGDVAVEVPEPGEIVHLTVEHDDGSTGELAIENPLHGPVSIVTQLEPIELATASPAPCLDGAYHLAGHHWTSEYAWSFQAASTPTANNKDNVESAIRQAGDAITTSRNSCALADQVSATNRYLGRTTLAPNIQGTSTTVTCGTRDAANVVGFGTLPAGTLAITCTWRDGAGVALESDIKYSTRYRWFALDVPSGCTSAFGIRQVGTHEFGHVFGLAHVSQSGHPTLTMSTQAEPCSNARFTLGLGDVRALRALY